MQKVKIWAMIAEPHCDTRTKTFVNDSIEACVEDLQTYLDQHTQPGTRTTIVQSGYVEEVVTNGI